ncbi:MAG TPA: hypothetical protein ENK31_02620 [Nannocystis exedens]|nr:hypothetical protein [Nannocystis exedens]
MGVSPQIEALIGSRITFGTLLDQFEEVDATTALPCTPGGGRDLLRLGRHYPEGSLGAIYQRFMAHYGFEPGFFPAALDGTDGSANERAAARMCEIHDLVHVLCGYEPSDDGERRLQSFMLAQAAVPCVVFFRENAAATRHAQTEYTHFRDLFEMPISWSDYARGQQATCLIGEPLMERLGEPLVLLRREFGIRGGICQGLINTCGLRDDPFFVDSLD